MKLTSEHRRVAVRSSGKVPALKAAGAAQADKPLRFDTILVPVDFSAPSKAALRYALELADLFDSRVRLLHVVEQSSSPAFDDLPLALKNRLITKARSALVKFAQTGSHPVIPVFPEVRGGKPWEQIVQAAREDNAALIVIPTHGRTGLKRVLMGSVAERVVRHAPCTVLVLRNKKVDLMVTKAQSAYEEEAA